jgi:hypothetical protein
VLLKVRGIIITINEVDNCVVESKGIIITINQVDNCVVESKGYNYYH